MTSPAFTTANREVAQTILSQLGGNRFVMMTGANKLTVRENGLSFKIGRNATQTNHVTISYDYAQDLYNMTFEKVSLSKKTWEVSRKVIATHEGVYCDQLTSLFTKETGLYTSL